MKRIYTTPVLLVIQLSSSSLICGSPNPGANEDVTYEDWEV